MNYELLKDEELVKLHIASDEFAFEYLVKRYARMINSLKRSYFLIGADDDDLSQEAYIGLDRAVKTYDEGKGKFATHAYRCIETRLINAVKKSRSLNNQVLNESKAMSEAEFIEGKSLEEDLISSESFKELTEKIKLNLSAFEIDIFNRYFIEGLSYAEIISELKIDSKKIENAVQRIKIKVKKLMEK